MIACDDQPISMVEREGFKLLMAEALPRYKIPGRTYFTEKEIPNMYAEIQHKLQNMITELLESNGYISFTTDIWSRDNGEGSMISFTAHFQLPSKTDAINKPRTLNVRSFEGSHTGDAISEALLGFLNEWNTATHQVHGVVTDNGANVKAGLRKAKLPGVPCAIHTLQLVVEEGLKAQDDIMDTVAKMRRVSGHFRHSSLANDHLEEMQKTYHCSIHKMVQDVATRWDSMYNMISRMIEQKKALVGYDSEYGLPVHLLNSEWIIAENLLRMLEPFQRTTKEFSHNGSSVSQVIPFIEILKLEIENQESGSVVQAAKEIMAKKLASRFQPAYSNQTYIVATLLDTRFKAEFLDALAVELATDEIMSLTMSEKKPNVTEAVSIADENSSDKSCDQPQEKRQRFSMWGSLHKVQQSKKAEKER
ncbi:zinc finger BED domain-containing protein 4-like [Watersipora subatra]|uniref:zinc finger BED domain-containing protein 4-like n=1 Tax=Watersipora subatra TaxID=2589382 RepID=UPI00355C93AB